MIPFDEYRHLISNLPNEPEVEISRSSVIKSIAESFTLTGQKQLIVSSQDSGKSNLSAQFCRAPYFTVLPYFVTSNPITQSYHSFLHSITNLMSFILGNDIVDYGLSVEELKPLYSSLQISLSQSAKRSNNIICFLVDGIELTLDGSSGERIIDYIPSIFAGSTNLLVALDSNSLDDLPRNFRNDFNIQDLELALRLEEHETKLFLDNNELDEEVVKLVHQQSNGKIGYQAIYKETIEKFGAKGIDPNYLPSDIKKLVANQIDHVFATSEEDLIEKIYDIACCPIPIPLPLLLEEESIDKIQELDNSKIVRFDKNKREFSIRDIYTRSYILEILGGAAETMRREMLEKANLFPGEYEHIKTHLLLEVKDYQGITEMLSPANVEISIKKNPDLYSGLDRFNVAAEIATKDNNLGGIFAWNWMISCTKDIFHDATTSDEVEALIAIGRSKEAIRKTYALPEEKSKIRLLANAYSEIKKTGEHVSIEQLDELRQLIKAEPFDGVEEDVVRGIALDLFPLLPDEAVSILEKTFRDNEQQNIVDIAIAGVVLNQDKDEFQEELITKISDKDLGYVAKVYSKWLTELDLVYVIKEADKLDNTYAKEFMIRNWCLQNPNSEELPYGIEFWINTIIEDPEFVYTLRPFRQISGLLASLANEQAKSLIGRIEIPQIVALRSPWQELFGYKLNILEAIYKYDKSASLFQFEELIEVAQVEVVDYDIKLFCYVKLLDTSNKLELGFNDELQANIDRVMLELLNNTSLHNESLEKVIRIVSRIDVDTAIEISTRLNTLDRRNWGHFISLKHAIAKSPSRDYTSHIEALKQKLDKVAFDSFIRQVCDVFWNASSIDELNTYKLTLKYANEIKSPSGKSEALIDLATVETDPENASGMVEDAIKSWQSIGDLKKKIHTGFDFVKRIAEIDIDKAKDLCSEVQSLLKLPGSDLAVGKLGISYLDAIQFSIRSLRLSNFDAGGNVDDIIELIKEIPAPLIKFNFLSEIAGKAIKVGASEFAFNMIEDYLLPAITGGDEDIKDDAIYYALPVLFEYNQEFAIGLGKELSEHRRSSAWYYVIAWGLTDAMLADIFTNKNLKVTSSYKKIEGKIIPALKEISEDHFIFDSIRMISATIRATYTKDNPQIVQAFDLLNSLEVLADQSLPDPNGIPHLGYKIISNSAIHLARSVVYVNAPRKKGVSKIDIREKWEEIVRMANDVPNLSDRVFVLTVVAEDLHYYNKGLAETIMGEVVDQAKTISTNADRFARLREIAELYSKWDMRTQGQHVSQLCIEMAQDMDPLTRDEKLTLVVQTMYELDPTLAEDMIKNVDKNADNEIHPDFEATVIFKKYSTRPELLVSEHSEIIDHPASDAIMRRIASGYLTNLIVGDSHVPRIELLEEMIRLSSGYRANVSSVIISWAIECINRNPGIRNRKELDLSGNFILSAKLIKKFSESIGPDERVSLPDKVFNSFPGLSIKTKVFETGQTLKAKDWIKEWLLSNSVNYIKICDPWFGPMELEFIADLPRDVNVFIVTTTKNFANSDQENLKHEIISAWDTVGKGNFPQVSIMIVPKELHGTFHDRVIITDIKGLTIGVSLNGLGKSLQYMTEISKEEALAIDEKYVQPMFNFPMWVENHKVQPIWITL